MDSAGEHIIKQLSAKNLCDVEQLHSAVYGSAPSPGFYNKKYDTSFTAIRHTGFIAYNHQNLPVAFYGVLPCFIRFPDKIVLAAQSADTMTHPDHRRKGLFVQLANLTFDLCRNSGIKLIFGFPNQNSLPGFLKLDWVSTETMGLVKIPLTINIFVRVFLRLRVFKNMAAGKRNRVLKNDITHQPGISNSSVDDGFAGIFRDHYYLKYKTYSPTAVIKLGESLVWLKVGNNLVIGDMQVAPEDFDKLMTMLQKLARQLWVKELQFHASPGTPLYNLFAQRYQVIPSFPVMFKMLCDEDMPLDKVKFTFADIDIF